MYSVVLVLLVVTGIWLLVHGSVRRRFVLAAIGGVLAVGTGLLFGLMDFWGEMLWFSALGYGDRFWDVILAKVLAGAAGGAVGATLSLALTGNLGRITAPTRLGVSLASAFVAGGWAAGGWDTILKFLHAAPTQLRDPVFELPVGFYLFHLPFYDLIYEVLAVTAAVAFLAVAVHAFVSLNQQDLDVSAEVDDRKAAGVYRCAGVLLLVLGAGRFLDRYHLLYSDWGVVSGPGWVDVHLRLPGLTITASVLALAGAVLLTGPVRRRLVGRLRARVQRRNWAHLYALTAVALLGVGVQAVALVIVPMLFQWLRVEPNEVTFERPYIENNIRFTRHGFRLHTVEEREYPVTDTFTRAMVDSNPAVFDNVRLWDWRALDDVYKQFQEIRLYYEFHDVDVDRYHVDGDYRQVMVSAREMQVANLPDKSQTFVNRRFKYTHGYGITLTNVSEFTPEGLPDLLVRDIPPSSQHDSLEVDVPQIYYGELTDTPAVVNTSEQEFDYPKGEENAYIHYPGKGGVQISNLWRKLLYGWKFDGMRFLLSEYPHAQSRIQFHRQIEERVQRLAPFLELDDDPYVVLSKGKLYWIVDAYTTTSFYPYSEPFHAEKRIRVREKLGAAAQSSLELAHFEGKNYVRNSVKAVVDAFDGTVDFYVFDDSDPLIRTWAQVFPGMFKARDEMPEALEAHVRYPSDMLLVQGLVYAKYHMTDPEVLYNQEDLWVRATEKYYGTVQPVAPYYIMWELPESDEPEFVLMLPFTPKNRQVMIGWIAGMSDGEDYGRFLAYKFPKEKRVLGPQQVETKIDQDRFLSGQLTLWDQRGSQVIRGNVLAIPIEDTLLYVEPIYLKAETAAYPELRLVVLMHDDVLSYAETFEAALAGLLDEDEPAKALPGAELEAGATQRELVSGAGRAFDDYLEALGDKRFDEAAGALRRLESALDQLQSALPPGEGEKSEVAAEREEREEAESSRPAKH